MRVTLSWGGRGGKGGRVLGSGLVDLVGILSKSQVEK